MGGVCSSCCGRSSNAQYEPLLLDNERDAVADLLQYLESEFTLACGLTALRISLGYCGLLSPPSAF